LRFQEIAMIEAVESVPAVGVAGSPSPASRSRALLDAALAALERRGAVTTRVDLDRLPADALLGRRSDPGVGAALAAVAGARVLVVSTPIYRATYSGLLKVFWDLFPPDALEGKVAIPLATGGSGAHLLAVDHGLRPLLASLGAVTIATGVYGTDAQFTDGCPAEPLLERVDRAAAEALSLVGAAAARVGGGR
jgi:FMN reductase